MSKYMAVEAQLLSFSTYPLDGREWSPGHLYISIDLSKGQAPRQKVR